MRILFAVHQFFPEYRAGTETLVLRTAQALVKRGHQVAVLTGGDHDPARAPISRHRYHGVDIHRLDAGPPRFPLAPGALRDTYRNPGLQKAIVSLLDEIRPDIVHAYHFRRLTLTLLDACALREIPLMASLTDYWTCCPTGQLYLSEGRRCPGPDASGSNCLRHLAGRVVPIVNRLPLGIWPLLGRLLPGDSVVALRARPAEMHAALRTLPRILVPTPAMLATLSENGHDTHRIRVCPYGIDLDGCRNPAPSNWWPASGRPLRIGFIGTLNEAKGAHVLLQALAHLENAATCHVSIFGSLTDSPDYVSRLRQAMGESVELCGTFEPDATFSTLHALDVLVVPSLWRENSPLIVQQAQAAGLPVVASRVDGIAHLIDHEDNGLLFEPGDSRALAACLRRLLAEPPLLAALASRARTPRSLNDYIDEIESHHAEIATLPCPR